MFGIKIIKESEYDRLQRIEKEHDEYANKLEKMLNKEVRDNNHLRDQLNAEMKKVRELEAKINESKVVSFRPKPRRVTKPDPRI
jgi:predicted DNA-binding protein YlxM (UPF0122 family)